MWNCRGLGNLQTIRVPKRLIIFNNLDVVVLSETKMLTSYQSFNLSHLNDILSNVHTVNFSTLGAGKVDGIKLDMAKVYDTMD